MIRTQIQLDEEQAERLRTLANERRVSIAALIREAVDTLLATDDREVRRQRARAAIGSIDSGIPDLGEEHDHYLYDEE